MFNDYVLIIGGLNVTGYLKTLNADQAFGSLTSESQKYTLELANPYGIWNDRWNKRTLMVCWLFQVDEDVDSDGHVTRTYYNNDYTKEITDIEYGESTARLSIDNKDPKNPIVNILDKDGNPTGRSLDPQKIAPLFVGEVQDCRYEQTVKINGACKAAKAASALNSTIDLPYTSAKDLAQKVVDQFGLGQMKWFEDDPNDDINTKKGGILRTVATRGQDALDNVNEITGGVCYVDEAGNMVFTRAIPKGSPMHLDKMIINPATAVNAIGWCNCVTVIAGGRENANSASWNIRNTTNNETQNNDLEIIYPDKDNPRDDQEKADIIKADFPKYGVLMAPVRREPTITSDDLSEVLKRARQLWKMYYTFKDVIPIEVVGISPPLRTYVDYYVYYWPDDDDEKEPKAFYVDGTVKRKITKFSSRSWTCNISVATKITLETKASDGQLPGNYYKTKYGPINVDSSNKFSTSTGKLGGWYIPKTMGAGFMLVNDTGYAEVLSNAEGWTPGPYQMLLYNPTTGKTKEGNTGDDLMDEKYQGWYEVLNVLNNNTLSITTQDILNGIAQSKRGGQA